MPQPCPEPDDEISVRVFVALRDGDAVKARLLAEPALRKNPKHERLRYFLVQSLIATNAAAKAITQSRRLVEQQPDNTWYRAELAQALAMAGKPDDALAEYDRVLEAEPDHDLAIRRRTGLLRNLGRGDEAWQDLQRRAATLPESANLAIAMGAVLPTDADAEDVIARLRRTAHDDRTAPLGKRTAHYLAARILDRLGRYDEAFDAATEGGELVPTHAVDAHAHVLKTHSPEFCERVEPADVDASNVVLLCGMPRSGSTVREQILTAHPRAASAGEFGGLPLAVHHAELHARDHGFVPRELSTKFAREYLKTLRKAAGNRDTPVLLDKMLNNLVVLGIAARLLPGVRVIRCLRDPRDTALSCYLQDFGDRHPYRSKLTTLADELLLQERAAERWRTELGDAFLETSLEQLIEHPEPEARRLVEHAGLTWDDALLDFHENVGQVRTASTEQVRTGLNASGVGRWKNYEKHLSPLIERLVEGGLL